MRMHPGSQLEPVKWADVIVKIPETPPIPEPEKAPPAQVLIPSPPPPVQVKTIDEIQALTPWMRKQYYSTLDTTTRKTIIKETQKRAGRKRWTSMSPEEAVQYKAKLDAARHRKWQEKAAASKSQSLPLPPIDSNKDKEVGGSPIQP